MKNILILLSISLYTTAQSQTMADNTGVPCDKGRVAGRYIAAQKMFATDLENKTVRLYVLGGIVSAIRESDRSFEKQYSLTYYDFGCVIPANIDLYYRYNQLVFAHLDSKFAGWRKSVHKSTLGLSAGSD